LDKNLLNNLPHPITSWGVTHLVSTKIPFPGHV
jgi:hypothetical protein